MALFVIGGIQVRIAQRTAHRQLRAYIAPDFISVTDGSNLTPPQDVGPVRGALIMKNFGQTPAYDVVIWSAIAVVRVSEEAKLAAPAEVGKSSQSTMGPTQSSNQIRYLGRALTDHEIAEIRLGERAVYLYGRANYRDVFGKRRFTNFRMKYTGQWPPAGTAPTLTFCDEGNEAD